MSQYNSEKFMAYKGLLKDRGKGDKERRCPHCGYDLRSHKLGDLCPECGQPMLYRGNANIFTTAPREYTRKLSFGAWLIIFSWICLMSVWLAAYFSVVTDVVILANLVGGFCAVMASRFISANRFTDHIVSAKVKNYGNWATTISIIAFVLSLIITIKNYSGVRTAWGIDNALTAVIAFIWIGYQALICLIAKDIADDAEFPSLARTFWNLVFFLGIIGPFASIFLSVIWFITTTRGTGPTCCLGGYFGVIGFLIAEIWFVIAIWRLTVVLAWTRKYQNFDYQRNERLKDQIQKD